MRISTAQVYASGLQAMHRSQGELNKAGLQLSTGKRILTPADDPSGSTQSAELRTVIGSIEQYQRNADLARPRLQQEEWAVAGVSDQLQRVRELLLQGNNESQTNETRRYMAHEIRLIRDGLYDVANTRDPNGEYLFGGTRSLDQPFAKDSAGKVTYVGAQGEGSVREVAVTPYRRVAIGDNGATVFMDMRENDGRVSADKLPGSLTVPPRGNLMIDKTEVSDPAIFQSGTNATDEFRIEFREEDDVLQYRVINVTQGDVTLDWAEGYDSRANIVNKIEFAGRAVYLRGEPYLDPNDPDDPSKNDQIVSRPARHVDLFATLETIAAALEAGAGGTASRADLVNAVNKGIADLDAAFEHLSNVRATIGARLQVLDSQSDLNADRVLNLDAARSSLEDLDYAAAISKFKLEQVALEAAQQSYVQVNRLTLFDYIR